MTSVVGYDLRPQVGILQKIARFFAQHERGRGASADGAAGRSHPFDVSVRRVALALGVIALLVGFFVWRARRKRAAGSQRAVSAEAAQAIKFYHELERALSARGYARPAASTPKEHARTLSERGFEYADEVRDLTERYMQVRYGAQAFDAQELARLQAVIAKVRSAQPASTGSSAPR